MLCPQCKSHNVEVGYGLAGGGGIGVYMYCVHCGHIYDKQEDQEMKEAMNEADRNREVCFTYLNHRGETYDRTVTPIRIEFGTSKWHDQPQWLLHGFCHKKQAERTFAMMHISCWGVPVK